MAIKFRRVKRPRRKHRRNPGSANVLWGAVAGLAVFFLYKKMAAKAITVMPVLPPAPKAAVSKLDMNKPDVSQLAGLGGIFGGTRGYGSL